jgi:hypothetical protein
MLVETGWDDVDAVVHRDRLDLTFGRPDADAGVGVRDHASHGTAVVSTPDVEARAIGFGLGEIVGAPGADAQATFDALPKIDAPSE